MNKKYVVAVTYWSPKHGKMPNQEYAAVPDLETANKLKEIAVSKGYYDARVLTRPEFNKLWSKRVTEDSPR